MASLFPLIERKIVLKLQMVASLKWKRLILLKNMVPFTNRIWYHFPRQYGTIFSFNMVPFSSAIWYHILFGFRLYWKSIRLRPVFKISLFLLQKGFSCFVCGFRNHRDMRPSTTCWERRRMTQKSAMRRTASGESTFTTETVFLVPSARFVLCASMCAAA